MESGTLKLMWATFQICSSVSFSLNVVFPYPYDAFSSFLSVVMLDIPSVDCLEGGYFLRLEGVACEAPHSPLLVCVSRVYFINVIFWAPEFQKIEKQTDILKAFNFF